MTPAILLLFLVVYFTLLLGVAYVTSRKSADNATFFVANRSAKWYMVAFGMIGTSLSGVTFISVPRASSSIASSFPQFVLGTAICRFFFVLMLLTRSFSSVI